jgi:hypothetical protein
LIGRAAELVTLDDTRAAIEQTKALQRAWKSIGSARRHQDEALWAEFRGHCDAVFQRSSQERAAFEAELATSQARAVALCEEVERLSQAADGDAAEAAGRLSALRGEFESLELPRPSARDLRRRFERAAESCDASRRRRESDALREAWTRALAAADRVRAYALGIARDLPPAEREELRVTAESAVTGLEHEPKGARGLLERRIADASLAPASLDLAGNEDILRTLCVRAELAAGLETPPEDLDRRREHQMRRLADAMARGERAGPGDLQALALEWLAVGPVEPSVTGQLRARFERCLDVLAR